MEYRLRKGLSNWFSCLLYVGQDISLSCRCSKDCDPVEVDLQGAYVTCKCRPLTVEFRAIDQEVSVQLFPKCHTHHSGRPNVARVCVDVCWVGSRSTATFLWASQTELAFSETSSTSCLVVVQCCLRVISAEIKQSEGCVAASGDFRWLQKINDVYTRFTWKRLTNHFNSMTSSWSSGKCVRIGPGRTKGQLSAGSYQDLLNWYCSLPSRHTVCRRAAGNTTRTQKQTRNCTN